MREIKAYACDYCRRFAKAKKTIINHEKICFRNPLVKACATCKHYAQEDIEPQCEEGEWVSRPICEAGEQLYRDLDNGDYKVRLKSNCKLWQAKEDPEE